MTIAYLVDTDWAIHHLNGHPVITQRLQDLQHEGLCLSVTSLGEIYEGVYYSRDPEESERALVVFLESVSLIGIDEETAVIIRGQEIAVLGKGTVTVALPDHSRPVVKVYHAGSRFHQPAVVQLASR